MAKLRFVIICLAVLGQPESATWAAEAAGRVVFAKGEVSTIDVYGTSRHLARGDKVFCGDTIVTGANGKANRKHFRLSTRTATIGIRRPSGLAEQCENGSCPNRADGAYLTVYNGILTLVSGPFSGDVYPRKVYFCDGEGCSKIGDHEAPPGPNPVVPEFNQRYREGDQQLHFEPGSPRLETPERFTGSSGIGASGSGPSRLP